ncbi:WXG100 family type VII secretion target [Mycobacterium sp. SMC-17]|uniref:WXG100 family type VII secretion target n=1 Tax=Mycobacterium sp. SMC-17 TaxID=3381628 RepID=UPI003876D053
MIIADQGGILDGVSSVQNFSGELEGLHQEATHLLQSSKAYFDSKHAGDSYTEVQNLINQAVDDCKQVMLRHGDALDTAGQNFNNTDIQGAGSFHGV